MLPPAVAASAGTTAADVAGSRQHVLVLNAFHPREPWTDRQIDGIEEVFSALPGAELHIEYLDVRRLQESGAQARLKAVYQAKYSDLRIDLIIALGDTALEVVARYRERAFPGVPVVYTGIAAISPQRFDGLGNSTGIIASSGFAANVALIQQLHPGTRHLYVIDNNFGRGQWLRLKFEEVVAAADEQLELEYLDAAEPGVLAMQLAQLPPKSVVFHLSLNVDFGLPAVQTLASLASTSNAPLYGVDDYLLGYGIVGGYLRDGFELGRQAGKMAADILAGTAADQLPVVAMPGAYRFDYRQLQRFNIDTAALPPGSVVVNQPETFWYRHKQVILTALVVLVALLVYIAVLLNSIRKRAKVERGLKSILDESHGLLPSDSAAEFADALRQRVARVVAVRGELSSFYCRSAEGADACPVITEIAPALAGEPSNAALIAKAVAQRRNCIEGDQFALYFDSDDMPVNLIYGRSRATLDRIDGHLLEMFVNTTAITADNIEKYKLMDAIDTARRIQESMLPDGFAAVANRYAADLHARLLPANEVSGDLYDFIEVDEYRLCLVIGDVSDKGVPSSLFMARTVTLIRATVQVCDEPEQIVDRVNRELCRNNDMSMFVTLFLAIYDRRDGGLSYCNGGHNPPYLLRARQAPQALQLADGMALGIMPEAGYVCQRVELGVGDALFAYTDGVNEAMDSNSQQFGERRLVAALSQLADVDADAMVTGVLQLSDAFTRGTARSDDTTVLVLRRLG